MSIKTRTTLLKVVKKSEVAYIVYVNVNIVGEVSSRAHFKNEFTLINCLGIPARYNKVQLFTCI